MSNTINKPSDSKNKVISYEIRINGSTINKKFKICRIISRKKVNKIGRATIYIFGGDTENNNFNESDEKIFDNGNEIEIKLGYEQQNNTVFKGLIDSHGVSLNNGYQKKRSKSLLIIECVDKAIKLTNSYTTDIYEELSDSNIFKNIIQKVSGLNSSIDETQYIHPIFPKYNNNDWNFLIERSMSLGLLVFNSNNNINIKNPSFSKQSELTVSNNGSTVSFYANQSSSNQYNKIIINAIESFKNNKISKSGTEPNTSLLSNTSFNKEMISLTTPDNIELNYAHDLSNSEIEYLASSKLKLSRLKRINGKVKFKGVPSLDLDSIVTLNGFGSKFNSDVYVTEVVHELEEGVILTEIGFGLEDNFLDSIDTLNKENNINKISGLHIGRISEISGDPKNELRVKVVIPELKEVKSSIWEGILNKGIWAKLTHTYISEDSGFYFMPDIGTQVIVSFLANDPKQPVVLGSLNTNDKMPYKEVTDGNNFKAIVTKNKMMLEFDELKNIITLCTANGNQIIINEEEKKILIRDENNNEIKTSNTGIEIHSTSDIKIHSNGNINMSANNSINIEAQTETSIKGGNIKNDAQIKFSANGSASSEITSSGATTVKGSIVQIN